MRKKKIKDEKMKNLLLNQKGMALLTTLIFIFILVTFGVALLSMTSNDIKLSALQRDSTKAFYIAEAGIERTLYNLKKDFETDKAWSFDDDINGYTFEDVSSEFRKINYVISSDPPEYEVSFGEGKYTVALKIINSKKVTIKSKGKYNKTTRYVQVDAKIGPPSIWDNAIFAGAGASGKVINGNVDIRGSVHLLGEKGGDPTMQIGVEIGGTGGIGNNYDGMDPNLRQKISDPPRTIVNGEEEDVETLNATLRVKHGIVEINSNAVTIGDPNDDDNSVKEKMDGVFVTEGFDGFVDNIHSDNGKDNKYDMGDIFVFPELTDAYIDPDTGFPYVDPWTGEVFTGTYIGYYEKFGLKMYDPDSPEAIKVSSISSDTESFHFPEPESEDKKPDKYGNYIEWNQFTQTLTIKGIMFIDAGVTDFAIGDKSDSITYSGTGTIVSQGNISISGNLLPVPGTEFPINALGLIAYENLDILGGTVIKPRQAKTGAFYAQKHITIDKQNEIAGTIVSECFNMGGQVPSIYQVPDLIDNIPPGMPGAWTDKRIYTSNWHEVHK